MARILTDFNNWKKCLSVSANLILKNCASTFNEEMTPCTFCLPIHNPYALQKIGTKNLHAKN